MQESAAFGRDLNGSAVLSASATARYKKAAVEIPATGTPTEPGKPTDSDSPQTGDNSNMILWIALLFISGGVLTGVTVFDKRKRHSVKYGRTGR